MARRSTIHSFTLSPFVTLRQHLRVWRRRPVMAASMIATLSIGLGVSVAVFSVARAVLLRPLPYANGDRMVVLHQEHVSDDDGGGDQGFSAIDLADYRQRAPSLDAIVEYHSMYFILIGHGDPERVRTGVVSHNYFGTLGVRPMLGRDFVEADDELGADAVLILGHDYWMTRFGGDKNVIGQVFEMNDRPHRVIGVLPPVPIYPQTTDVYMPTSACPFRSSQAARTQRGFRMVTALGRVKSDTPPARVDADLAAASAGMRHDFPGEYKSATYNVNEESLSTAMATGFEPTMKMLFAAGAFILVIACASVANLVLARTAERRRELAVRQAIGAGGRRLAWLLIGETLALSSVGALGALLVGVWGASLLKTFAARFTPRAAEIQMDWTVALFAVGATVAVALIAAVVSLTSLRKLGPADLIDGARTTSRGDLNLRRGLIIAQVAVSFALVVGAGLLLRSLLGLESIKPGLRTERVLTARVALDFTRYGNAATTSEFIRRTIEKLSANPEVVSVAAAGQVPLSGGGTASTPIIADRQDVATPRRTNIMTVSAGYFKVLEIPILTGRAFDEHDTIAAAPVAIVSSSLARSLFSNSDVVGHRVSFDNGDHWFTVVGIVADSRMQIDQEPGPMVYRPTTQSGAPSPRFFLALGSRDANLDRFVADAVHSVDGKQPVDQVLTLEQVRDQVLAPSRLTTAMIGLLAGAALLMTAMGLGGVISVSVRRRLREFGIRSALGARKASLVSRVLGEGAVMAAIGIVVGVGLALGLGGVIRSQLIGIRTADPLTYGVVALIVVLVTIAACVVPARQAASVDPATLFRSS